MSWRSCAGAARLEMANKDNGGEKLGIVIGKIDDVINRLDRIEGNQTEFAKFSTATQGFYSALKQEVEDHKSEHDKYMRNSMVGGGLAGGVLGSVIAGFMFVYEFLHGRGN